MPLRPFRNSSGQNREAWIASKLGSSIPSTAIMNEALLVTLGAVLAWAGPYFSTREEARLSALKEEYYRKSELLERIALLIEQASLQLLKAIPIGINQPILSSEEPVRLKVLVSIHFPDLGPLLLEFELTRAVAKLSTASAFEGVDDVSKLPKDEQMDKVKEFLEHSGKSIF